MFAHSSSSSQNKRKVIKDLKEINRERVYSQYKTYYKIYKQQPKHSSSLYPLKTNYDFTKNTIDAMFTMSNNPKSHLNTFYKTIYTSPEYRDSNSNSNINNEQQQQTTQHKQFFGIDAKAPLTPFGATQYAPTTYTTVIINHPKVKQYTEEDEELIRNAFHNVQKKFLDKDTTSEIYHRYNINKKLTNEEKIHIYNTLRPKCLNAYYYATKDNPNTGIFCDIKGDPTFMNPFKAGKTVKLKAQIAKKAEEIRNVRQFNLYKEQFDYIEGRKLQLEKMPKIKVVSKRGQKIAEKRSLKLQKLMDYSNIAINLGDVNKKEPTSMTYINANGEIETKTREELLSVIDIDVRYIGSHYHPCTRTNFALTFGEGTIFVYGGVAGRALGDLWGCDIMNKKRLVWKKIFDVPYTPLNPVKQHKKENYNNDNESQSLTESISDSAVYEPIARYGHSMHYYNRKLYIIGGLFQNWMRNKYKDTLLIVYDIVNKMWSRDPSIPKDVKDGNNKHQRDLNNSYCNSNLNNSISNNNNNILHDNSNERQIHINTPCLRRNHTSILIGTTIFVYGGINQQGTYLNDCWVYNLKSSPGWQCVDIIGRIPPQLAYHCSTLALEKEQLYNPSLSLFKVPESTRKTVPLLKYDGVFFFGGMNDNRVPTSLFFVMKIGKKQIEFEIPTTHGKPPLPRISASMDFYPNLNIIIIHGGRNDRNENSIYNDYMVLDLETMNWIQAISKQDKAPSMRAEHQSFIFGNKLLILGGVNRSTFMDFDFAVTNLDFI
jgi:hypothetical protein